MDISSSLIGNSDQLDNVDLMSGPRDFTIVSVTAGTGEQPLNVALAEFSRPWRPGLTMRRVLAGIWGPDASLYAGRRVRLYRDGSVTFGKDATGGTRISHASHINKAITLTLPTSRGKFGKFTIDPLPEAPAKRVEPVEVRASKAIDWYAAKGVTKANLEAHVGKPVAEWTASDLDALLADSDQLSALPQSGADIDPNAGVA